MLSYSVASSTDAAEVSVRYEDDSICGNIVKCRWALSDCEFCREMLEQLHQRTGETTYANLAEESRQIADAVRERIMRLRKHVWW